MNIKFFSELTEEQVKFIAETNYNYWKKYNPALDYNESTGNIIAMRKNVNILPIGIALIDMMKLQGFALLERTD